MRLFHRRSTEPTDPALLRARTVKKRPTLPYEAKPTRVQDKFPTYDDFAWKEIEAYLKLKWPKWTDFKPSFTGGYCQFEVPEELTEDDINKLKELRDGPKRARRASVSEDEHPVEAGVAT